MQNQKYVAPGGAKNNRTVAEALKAERLLKLLGIPTFGIVAIAPGGLERVELVDFEAVGIDTNLPANLEIRTSWGNGPDKNAAGEEIENDVPDGGEFMSVDKVLDWQKAASSPAEAASELLGAWKPGIKPAEVQTHLMNLPGVAAAYNDAVKAALSAS